ncbi:MAG: molecular chaperone TorD family protein [Nitrospinaceae bacterium]|jgi:nitrate reductase delta subunit|nr:molecular chaperone TorD family protein [Nitrospinaceae bacterium]
MSNINGQQTLTDTYALIAELWCSPPETDTEREGIKHDAEKVVERLKSTDEEIVTLLSRFLRENIISEEDYIDLFELEPQCPLYLGSHTYDEPKTCANAAVSDRNGYMIELVGIYKHFGQKLDGRELPDYLPLMVDFLSLTAESKDDPVREKLIREYFLPFLPPMRSRLKELKTPYLYLLDALEKVVNVELKSQAQS